MLLTEANASHPSLPSGEPPCGTDERSLDTLDLRALQTKAVGVDERKD
jgi:hypothetical protein